jgi:hypothetical protein
MASPIPRPVIAQAVIFLVALVIFSGVLTIFGSVPTSRVPEHPASAGNVTTTPVPEVGPVATESPVPGPDDSLSVTVTPVPGSDDSITATPAPLSYDSIMATVTPTPDESIIETPTPVADEDAMISQPDMDAPSLPVYLSGSGSQSTSVFRLEPGTIAFDISSDSPGNIEVWLMMYDGERFDRLLENGLIAEGPLYEQIVTGGSYFLEVTADGQWQIYVSQL